MPGFHRRRHSRFTKTPSPGMHVAPPGFVANILAFWTFPLSGPFDHMSGGRMYTGTYVTPANIAARWDGLDLYNVATQSAYAQVANASAPDHLSTVGFVGVNFTMSNTSGANPYLMSRATGNDNNGNEFRVELFSGSLFLTIGNPTATASTQKSMTVATFTARQRCTALVGWDPGGFTLFFATGGQFWYSRQAATNPAGFSNNNYNIALGGIDLANARNLDGVLHWAIYARSVLDDTIGKRLHLSIADVVPGRRYKRRVGAAQAATFRRPVGGVAGRRSGVGSSGGL